jgi:endonuclease/exonuclease/phosphatase family metal-dependent hydrolase
MKNRVDGERKASGSGEAEAAVLNSSCESSHATSLDSKARAGLPAACLLIPIAFCLLLNAHGSRLTPAIAGAHDKGRANLLETGSASKLVKPAPAPSELKIVSYNIRWRGGEDLRKLIELLRDDAEVGGASVIGLQEVDRNKKRTDFANTAREIAEALGMNYAWAAPPPEDEEEETGVTILSPYKLTDVERMVLPHEGPNKRRRAAVGATVHVGETPVRFYSVHAETRMPLEKKIEHWRAVLDDLARYPKITRAVVVGDFNTIKGKDVRAARRLFSDAGFQTPFPDSKKTFKTFIFELKLDWVWLRGFDEAESYGIDKQIELSDHWPLWTKVKFNAAATPSAGARRSDGRP